MISSNNIYRTFEFQCSSPLPLYSHLLFPFAATPFSDGFAPNILENKALDDGRRDLFMGLVDQKIQVSDVMNNHHSLINLTDDKIIHITNKTIKIEPDKIINDIKKREIPRFKYDPPAQSVASALQQLIKFTDQMSSVEVPQDVLSLKDFKVQDLDLVSSVQKMITLKDAIEMMECRTAPDISKIFGPNVIL